MLLKNDSTLILKQTLIALAGSLYGYLLNFIIPIKYFLFLVGILVLVDLYFGTRAAKKGGDKINGDGIKKCVEKTKDYFVAILVTEAMRLVFFKDSLNITYVISGIISVAEYYSIIGHVSELTGLDILTTIKEYIGDRITKRVKNGGKDEPIINDTAIKEDSPVS